MDGQDFLDLSSRQEHLMREMNAYLKAIDITDSPGDNSAATMKVYNSQNKTLSSRLKVPPLATITSSSSSSSSSSGSTDSTTKDSSTTNDNTEVEKKKRQGRRRSLTNHLNSIDEQANGSKISADCYNHIYNEGQKVIYTNAEGSCLAVITKVHYDDELQPYYTIEIIEGREKQTDNNHLSRFNESEYEYFNEANTTTSSSQFEDDSLVAMAKRMDDSQTIISDPSLISCGAKEKTLLTLPNLPNITKKLGISKGKQPIQSQAALESPLHSDDEDDNKNISSDSSSSASVEVFDYNGMTREQVMSMNKGRSSPSDASSGNNEEGRRSRGGSRKKNGEKTRRHRSPTEEKRTATHKSRHRSSSKSRRRRRDKDRKRRQHKHDDDDESHGIGFNTRVNKSDMDGRRRTAQGQERPPIQQSHSRRQHRHHNNHTKKQIDQNDDSSDSDEHSSYDSDDCTQIFYESTDDEWCSADSEEELVAVGTSVTDAVNNLNKKRGVKSLFGLR